MDWKEILISFLYPKRCPICGQIPKGKGRQICPECEKHLIPIKGARCFQCSKPLDSMEKEYCRDCISSSHTYKRGIAVYPYNEYLKKSIFQIKYHNKREYLAFYGERIAREAGSQIMKWAPDVIIPIPLYKKKQRVRGFNQAGLLADHLGRILGIPVEDGLLERVRNTVPQKELNRKERQNNLKKAFKIVQNDVKLRKVLLVDDIYTTGSTIDAAASALLDAGAREVYFVTLCIGRGGV